MEADPPPTFPIWLKDIVPALRAEHANGVYIAFHRRRCFHSRPGWLTGKAGPGATLPLFGLVLLLLFGNWLGLFPTLLLLVAAGCAVALHRRLSTGTREDVPGLRHRWVADLFNPQGIPSQAAMELWLAGVSGAEVAEAMFLEFYERDMRILRIGPHMFAAVIAGMIYLLKADFLWFEHPLILSIFMPAEICARMMCSSSLGQDCATNLRRTYAQWLVGRSVVTAAEVILPQGDEPQIREHTRTRIRGTAICIFLFAIWYTFAGALYSQSTGAKWPGLEKWQLTINLAWMVGTGTTALLLSRRKLRRESTESYNRLYAEAGPSFEAHMLRMSGGGLDEEDWFARRYGKMGLILRVGDDT